MERTSYRTWRAAEAIAIYWGIFLFMLLALMLQSGIDPLAIASVVVGVVELGAFTAILYLIWEARQERKNGGVKLNIVCAWCGKELGEKDGKGETGTSHGMCDDCFRLEMRKLSGEIELEVTPPSHKRGGRILGRIANRLSKKNKKEITYVTRNDTY